MGVRNVADSGAVDQDLDGAVGLRGLPAQVGRAVGRAVVHDHDPMGQAQGLDALADAFEERAHVPRLVVGGDHDVDHSSPALRIVSRCQAMVRGSPSSRVTAGTWPRRCFALRLSGMRRSTSS